MQHSSSLPLSVLDLDVDFDKFLARADPEWHWGSSTAAPKNRPDEWVSSLIGGNGDLGFQLWSPSNSALQLDISSKSLWDDRTPDLQTPSSFGPKKKFYVGNFVDDQPRLPSSGHFEISWPSSGKVPVLASGRMSLYNARAILNITTTTAGGGFSIAVWASADYETADVVVVETRPFGPGDGIIPSVKFVPADLTKDPHCSVCIPNLPSVTNNVTTTIGNINTKLSVTVQQHRKGTAHALAVAKYMNDTTTVRVVALSPILSSNAAASSNAVARAKRGIEADPLGRLRSKHEAWWHEWWPSGGFLTVDHSPLESFFYIQLFKFASAARPGRGVHDLLGPWYIKGTPWPDLHWDLNIQQTYYFPTEANRPDLSSTLTDYMELLHASTNLQTNVPVEWQDDSAEAPNGASSLSGNQTCNWDFVPVENTSDPLPYCTSFLESPETVGNLMWTLSLIERVAAYNGNQTILTDVLCPLLDKSLQFFQHLQVGGNSTMPEIHLPPTMSPEYPHTVEADANYAIALYRWGLQTAISLADRFPDEESCGGSLSSDSIGYQHYLNWTSTLKLLTWFPIDNVTNTLEIYRGVPYGVPHRHYSHLFSIWPLHLLDLTNETQSTTAQFMAGHT